MQTLMPIPEAPIDGEAALLRQELVALYEDRARLQQEVASLRNQIANPPPHDDLTAILDALPARVAIVDAAGNIRAVNEAWRRFAVQIGFACADFGVGSNYLTTCAMLFGKDADTCRDFATVVHAVLSGEHSYLSRDYPCHTQQNRCWHQVIVSALGQEERRSAVVMHMDITERKQAEEARRAADARYRALVQSSSDVIQLFSEDGALLYTSPSVQRVLGYTPEEIIGQSGVAFLHPEDVERAVREFEELVQHPATPRTFEARVRHKDGSWCWVEAAGTDLRTDPAVQAIVVNFRDITEAKRVRGHLDTRIAQLSALRTVDGAISSAMDLHVILSIIIRQIQTTADVDAAAMSLLDRHLNTLEYAVGSGFTSPEMAHSHLHLGHTLAMRAVHERRRITVDALTDSKETFNQAKLPSAEGFVSHAALPLITKGKVNGVLEVFYRTPLVFSLDHFEFLEALAGQAAIAIDSARLLEDLKRSNAELTHAYDATIEGWSRALDLRDKETEGHSRRVALLTLHLARALGVPAEQLEHIRRGALLHDIGKMGIPDRILLKPDILTAEETELMRRHPDYAYKLLEPIGFLHPALDIPYCHHERWDGSGYPQGLEGEQIPLAARIFAVADVWDALRSDRPYRPAWPAESVRAYIRDLAGVQFDPAVVKAFLAHDVEDLI